jgi:hypothetical protein
LQGPHNIVGSFHNPPFCLQAAAGAGQKAAREPIFAFYSPIVKTLIKAKPKPAKRELCQHALGVYGESFRLERRDIEKEVLEAGSLVAILFRR